MTADGDLHFKVETRSRYTASGVPEPTRPGRSALDYLLRSCDLATRSAAWRLLGSDDLDDVLLEVYDRAHRLLGRATSSEIALHLHRAPVWSGTRDAAEQLRRIVIKTCVERVLRDQPIRDEGPAPLPVGADEADRIRWAWRSVPGDQRLVLALALHERHKLDEIAALLDVATTSAEHLLSEARSTLSGALTQAGFEGRAGGGDPLIGKVIRQIQQLDPPRHQDDFWKRVDRRLDRLEGRHGTVAVAEPSTAEPPDQPGRRRRPLLAAVAAIAATGSLLAAGWLVVPDTSTDEDAAAASPIGNTGRTSTSSRTGPAAPTTGTSDAVATGEVTDTSVADDSDGDSIDEAAGDSGDLVDGVATPVVAAPGPGGESATGASTTVAPAGATSPGSAPTTAAASCVDPPAGWGAWEAADTGPNQGDEVYIEIFVVDDEPCRVTVEVTVDVWIWDDHVVSPYVELAGDRQVIRQGKVGHDLGTAPFTAVLEFDKPTSPAGWVLGYAEYSYDPDAGLTMGPEQSPTLTDLG